MDNHDFQVINQVYNVVRSETIRAQFLAGRGMKFVPRGYEVDHIIPLWAGGKDEPSNMQILTIEGHKTKTKHETAVRRKIKTTGRAQILRITALGKNLKRIST